MRRETTENYPVVEGKRGVYWKDTAAVNELSEAQIGLFLAQMASSGGSQKAGLTTLDGPLHPIESFRGEIGSSQSEVHRATVAPEPIGASFISVKLKEKFPISGNGAKRGVGRSYQRKLLGNSLPVESRVLLEMLRMAQQSVDRIANPPMLQFSQQPAHGSHGVPLGQRHRLMQREDNIFVQIAHFSS